MKVYEKPIPFGDAVRFHGHSGPFLALGFKAGSYAMGKLHPEGIKDIACRINTIMSTPYTCIIDGIQCSSHCTLGKGNLVSTMSEGGRVEITFVNGKSNRTVSLEVKPSVLSRLLAPEGSDNVVEWVLSASITSLFDLKEA